MWSIDLIFDAVEHEIPEKDVYALDEIHQAVLLDNARIGIPVEKVLFMILWYADGIMRSSEATPEEKLSTASVIRAVEKIGPPGFKDRKDRLEMIRVTKKTG